MLKNIRMSARGSLYCVTLGSLVRSNSGRKPAGTRFGSPTRKRRKRPAARSSAVRAAACVRPWITRMLLVGSMAAKSCSTWSIQARSRDCTSATAVVCEAVWAAMPNTVVTTAIATIRTARATSISTSVKARLIRPRHTHF